MPADSYIKDFASGIDLSGNAAYKRGIKGKRYDWDNKWVRRGLAGLGGVIAGATLIPALHSGGSRMIPYFAAARAEGGMAAKKALGAAGKGLVSGAAYPARSYNDTFRIMRSLAKAKKRGITALKGSEQSAWKRLSSNAMFAGAGPDDVTRITGMAKGLGAGGQLSAADAQWVKPHMIRTLTPRLIPSTIYAGLGGLGASAAYGRGSHVKNSGAIINKLVGNMAGDDPVITKVKFDAWIEKRRELTKHTKTAGVGKAIAFGAGALATTGGVLVAQKARKKRHRKEVSQKYPDPDNVPESAYMMPKAASIGASAILSIAKRVDTSPTDAQVQSGNYRKGHLTMHGMKITLENPKGATRSGVAPDGKEWSTTMKHHYGYIKGTTGRDGDEVDVFVGDTPESELVTVINQVDASSAFDEHKVMLGFVNEEEAKRGYLANYDRGWTGLGSAHTLSVQDFKAWLKDRSQKRPLTKSAGGPVSTKPLKKTAEDAEPQKTPKWFLPAFTGGGALMSGVDQFDRIKDEQGRFKGTMQQLRDQRRRMHDFPGAGGGYLDRLKASRRRILGRRNSIPLNVALGAGLGFGAGKLMDALIKRRNRETLETKTAGGPGSGIGHNNTSPITERPKSKLVTIGTRKAVMSKKHSRRHPVELKRIKYVAQDKYVIKKLAWMLEHKDEWKNRPIKVLFDPDERVYHLMDGHHRFLAALRLGMKSLKADVWEHED
jgi:hypothetical protein